MTDLISVTVNDGKYTIQQTENGKWEALRYGEEWPAFRDSGPDNLHVALAYEIAALRALTAERDRLLGALEKVDKEAGRATSSTYAVAVSACQNIRDIARAAIAKAEGRA